MSEQSKSGWQSYPPGQKPPQYKEPDVIAAINVKLYGLESGRSQIQVEVSPSGPLGSGATGQTKIDAYKTLESVLQRELHVALTKLGEG